MTKSALRCWWCVGCLEARGGVPVFRELPDGRKVHVVCAPAALEYVLREVKPVTAQPTVHGKYRE